MYVYLLLMINAIMSSDHEGMKWSARQVTAAKLGSQIT